MLGFPQFQALTALAKRLGLSFSEVLRRAIDAYLKEQQS
jgi:DNA-binding Lrp family transcriptional regulator